MAKVILTVRIDPELREALKRLAALHSRSVTAELEDMIAERARKAGELPKTWRPKPRRA